MNCSIDTEEMVSIVAKALSSVSKTQCKSIEQYSDKELYDLANNELRTLRCYIIDSSEVTNIAQLAKDACCTELDEKLNYLTNKVEIIDVYMTEGEGWSIKDAKSIPYYELQKALNMGKLKEINDMLNRSFEIDFLNDHLIELLKPYQRGSGIDLKDTCRITLYYYNVPLSILENFIIDVAEDTFLLLSGITELVKNREKAIEVVSNNLWFNYYTDIDNYRDLAAELINDTSLWENSDEADETSDNDEFYNFINNEEDEEKLKEYLNSHGWSIASNGLAVCLSDEAKHCISDEVKELWDLRNDLIDSKAWLRPSIEALVKLNQSDNADKLRTAISIIEEVENSMKSLFDEAEKEIVKYNETQVVEQDGIKF